MSHVFHRQPAASLPTISAGDGNFLIDVDGNRYLDACGGAAVSCLGHDHPAIRAALHAQIDKVAFAHTAFFTNEPMEQLADRLAAKAPGDLNRVYFLSGGSESNEAALKLARQYFLELGEPKRRHIIARRQSYHGNTLGVLAAGGNQWRREPFEPMLIETHHIAPCYAYRDRRDDESEEDYGLRVANELEETILRLGADTVAAFIAETVVGATAGAVPPVSGYFKRIREICDRYGVLLILDEVMCGMGRTGTLFACEQEAVVPDILTIAKGIGAGYQPLSAMLVADRIYDAIVQGSGFFQHGHTYSGHSMACAAGVAVLDTIDEDNLLENVRKMGDSLQDRLQDRFGNHHHIGDIRGRGLFIGLELVADRARKTPFDPARKIHGAIKKAAMARGLMIYPGGGTIDGRQGNHILLAPPFTVSEAEADMIVDRLGDSLDDVLGSAQAA